MNKLEEAQYLVEECISFIQNPMYRELEVGFRHSPLSKKEVAERYAETFGMLKQNLLAIQEALVIAEQGGRD